MIEVKVDLPNFKSTYQLHTDDPYCLPWRSDPYQGVNIDCSNLSLDPDTFHVKLAHGILKWKVEGRKGVWLSLNIHQSHFIPIAAKFGFRFHNAEADRSTLCLWLPSYNYSLSYPAPNQPLTRSPSQPPYIPSKVFEPEELLELTSESCFDINDPDTISRLPIGATHQVGVGCIVLHPTLPLILAVQEKKGPLGGSGVWKIPTGLLDQGEDIYCAAIREIKEETGLEAKFSSLLSIRQSHNVLFGKSDLFFVALLEVQLCGKCQNEGHTSNISENNLTENDLELTPSSSSCYSPSCTCLHPKPQEEEIETCAWLSPNEYFNQEFFKKSPLHSLLNKIIKKEFDIEMNRRQATEEGIINDIDSSYQDNIKLNKSNITSENLSSSFSISRHSSGWVPTELPIGWRPGKQVLYHPH